MNRILIFANGELPDPDLARALVRPDDTILCADGGTHHVLALGLRPDLVIGDLDSLAKDEWKKLEQAGVSVELHPRDKDQTDLELALNYALARQPASILVVAALGRRLDQTIGNLSLLADARLAGLDVRLADGLEQAFFCRSRSELHGRRGDLVSLIPWQAAVPGIRTEGLKWPLRDETLYPEKTRGISNEMLGEAAAVSIASGLLLIVQRSRASA